VIHLGSILSNWNRGMFGAEGIIFFQSLLAHACTGP